MLKTEKEKMFVIVGYAITKTQQKQWLFMNCDIKTYDENILIKLFYPLLNDDMGYSFSKGYLS